jgi:hypothetical protein
MSKNRHPIRRYLNLRRYDIRSGFTKPQLGSRAPLGSGISPLFFMKIRELNKRPAA